MESKKEDRSSVQLSREDLIQELADKKVIVRSQKLFEVTGQVPAPSKDFCQLLVNTRGIVWRKWKITLRGVSRGYAPSPTESVMTYLDFKYDKELQNELELIFGDRIVRHVLRIISGSNDPLSSLPEDLLVHVVTFLDLESIDRLQRVNLHVHEVCNSDKLWERLYSIHQGRPSPEICSLAKELSWQEVFFMNKLQLQKEISRRRNATPTGHAPSTSKGVGAEKSSTFLTQMSDN